MSNMFIPSVSEAVSASMQQNKPLIVCLVGKELVQSEIQWKNYISRFINESNVTILDGFVMVMLVEGTQDFTYFKEIFREVECGWFYVVFQGKLLAHTKDPEGFNEVLNRYRRQETAPETTTNSNSNTSTLLNNRSRNPKLFKTDTQEYNRIKKLIDNDKRERMVGTSTTSTTPTPASTPTTTPTTTSPSGFCSLSIRLLDGKTIKHDFPSTSNLNDVRKWLDSESGLNLIPNTSYMPSFASPDRSQPSHYCFNSPGIPRVTYSDNEEFQTLASLSLVPRSVIILKPVYDDTMAVAYTNKTNMFLSAYNSVKRLGDAVYSFFDYGVDARDEGHDTPSDVLSDPSSEGNVASPKVLMIDDKPKRPTLINFDEDDQNLSRVSSNAESISRVNTPATPSMSRLQTVHDKEPPRAASPIDGV